MIWEAVDANRRLTWFYLVVFVLLITAVGYVFGMQYDLGPAAVVLALVFALVSAWSTYYYGDRMILAVSGARPADPDKDARLFHVTEGLCLAATLPMPRLYVIEDSAPNAFASGRDPQHAVLCATTGLLDKMERDELSGVVAHELSHIGNYDIRLMAVVSVLAGAVALLCDWFWRGFRHSRRSRNPGGGLFAVLALAAAILAPLAAMLMQLAISRRREFLADAGSAQLTRNPDALADALAKLDADPDPLEAANKGTAPLYIVNPLKEHGGWLNSLFSTHPPIAERVSRLRAM